MKKILLFIYVFGLMVLSIPAVKAKSYGWGYKPNDSHTPPDVGIYKKVIEGTSSVYIGDPAKKTVYFTFDAGYDNGTLPKILNVLKEKNVKATFFVTGDFIRLESRLVNRIASEGHLVGNHTWSHKNIATLTFEELQSEIGKVEEAYKKVTNREMAKLFRPPAGEFSRDALLNVQKLGYHTVFWSLAYRDWETGNQRGRDYAYQKVMDQLHNGAIILMHTVSSDNLEALPQIIDDIRHQGYTIQNIDSLVANHWLAAFFNQK